MLRGVGCIVALVGVSIDCLSLESVLMGREMLTQNSCLWRFCADNLPCSRTKRTGMDRLVRGLEIPKR